MTNKSTSGQTSTPQWSEDVQYVYTLSKAVVVGVVKRETSTGPWLAYRLSFHHDPELIGEFLTSTMAKEAVEKNWETLWEESLQSLNSSEKPSTKATS